MTMIHFFKSEYDPHHQIAFTFPQWNALVDCCDREVSGDMAVSFEHDWIEPFENYDRWFADDDWSRCKDGRNTTITRAMATAMSEVLQCLLQLLDDDVDPQMANYVKRMQETGDSASDITVEQIKSAAEAFIEFERVAKSDLSMFLVLAH